MTNEFTLKDLKNGDICKLSIGIAVIAIPETQSLSGQEFDLENPLYLAYYSQDLNYFGSDCGLNTCYDIVEVYRPNAPYQCSFDSRRYMDGDLVFKRDPEQNTVKMTREQVSKIIGRNVEFI